MRFEPPRRGVRAVMDANGTQSRDDGFWGRADPARSAHLSAAWRCAWVAEEKSKNSLRLRKAMPGQVRRKKVNWAGRGSPALTVSKSGSRPPRSLRQARPWSPRRSRPPQHHRRGSRGRGSSLRLRYTPGCRFSVRLRFHFGYPG